MAAIVLDPMEFMQQLEASGMPRSQAEAVVKGDTAMLVHNFDALVTKDYLDTRFSEFESRVDVRFLEAENRTDARFKDLESKMDLRFAETDGKLKDMESRIDLRFAAVESRIDLRFAGIETRFARVNVVLSILLVGIIIPNLQAVLTWIR